MDFYKSFNKIKSCLESSSPVKIVKLKRDLESEEEFEVDDYNIPKLDDSGDDDSLPDAYKHMYGTDNYEWDNYNRPNNSYIYKFGEEKYFCSTFKILFLSHLNIIRKFLNFPMWHNLMFFQTARI